MPRVRVEYFSSLLVLLFLFFHFPFSGYITEFSPSVDIRQFVVSPECKALNSRTEFKGNLDDEFKLNQRCAVEWDAQLLRTVELPFSEWTSNEPVIKWFGNIVHLLASISLALILGALWTWTFKSESET